MDEPAAHRPTGTMDAHASVLASARGPARGPSIDGPGPRDASELGPVFQAIAARLDVLLDEKRVAGLESEGPQRAARAWSAVVGKRSTDVTSDLRRRALATTVFRISGDGRVDVDDRQLRIVDDESRTEAEDRYELDGQTDAPSQATTGRADIEGRLREARRRLAARRGEATASRVVRPRASRIRPSARPKTGIHSLVGWLLIGLTLVAVSAVVSILVG